jgi:hypothetical protein
MMVKVWSIYILFIVEAVGAIQSVVFFFLVFEVLNLIKYD